MRRTVRRDGNRGTGTKRLPPGEVREFHLDVLLSQSELDRLDGLARHLGLNWSECVRRAVAEMGRRVDSELELEVFR
jgi:hypothetical protein